MRTCTRGPWNWSTMSGSDIQGKQLHPTRHWEGKLFRDGKARIQKGQLYGVSVNSHEEADRIALLYGYTQPYGRNTTRLVMTRAARRRGYKATDRAYLRKEAEHCMAGK